jgi:thiamine pyrophosphate-dependent acetolactate synthase large subunit-like protein
MTTIKVHAALACALADHGVDTLFGLAGDGNLFFIDYFIREKLGTYVAAAHEAGAVLMAGGYANVSGRVGVATVTHGPALTNTVTALVENVRSRTPIVLIAGDTTSGEKENLQDIDQQPIVLPTGAGFEQVRSPETVADDLAMAMRRALTERRPLVLNVPVEYQWADIDYRPAPLRSAGPQALAPDPAVLDQAMGILAYARRPIVLAGRGASTPAARAALLRLAERIGAPVATTLKARDLFRGEPFDLGIFGSLSHPVASAAIQQSDCVIAFGASLNKWTALSGGLLAGKKVIHCDIDPAQLGRLSPFDVAVLGDSRTVAETITNWLDEASIAPSGFRSEPLRWQIAEYRPVFQDDSTTDSVDLRSLLLRLEQEVPKDRVLVTDGGQYIFDTLKLLHVEDPASYVHTVNFGSIGLGMGSAIGASFAAPGRPVLLVTGDGGFTLGGLTEFNTAVRHGVDLIVVVCNNHCYGPEYVHFESRNMNPALSLFDWPDFAPVAEALGGTGLTVRNAQDLDLLPDAIAGRDRPLLIDAKTDPARVESEREPRSS